MPEAEALGWWKGEGEAGSCSVPSCTVISFLPICLSGTGEKPQSHLGIRSHSRYAAAAGSAVTQQMKRTGGLAGYMGEVSACECTDRHLLRLQCSQGGLHGPVLSELDLRPSGNEPHYSTAVPVLQDVR